MEAAEKKTTKKTEKITLTAQAQPNIQGLISSGIPVKMAVFHRAVKSYKGEPENAFYRHETNMKPSRVANMWYTPHGLLCEQKGNYKLIPLANVSDTNISEQDA